MLSESRKNEIEAMTRDVLTGIYGDMTKVNLPVDITKVVKEFNTHVQFVKFKDESISGAFEKDTKTIYIADKESFPRKMFSIAHELGHLLLHTKKEREFFYRMDILKITEEERTEDQEANWFAASLLMPKELVTRYWEASKSTDLLTRLFGVSPSAVYFRLKNLGLVE